MGFRENIRKPLWVNSVASIICWLQWAQGRLSCTDAKLKCVLWCDEVTFKLFFKNHGYCVLRANKEKDHPGCYQRKVQKTASVMVWGCVSANGMDNLHICEGNINAKRYKQVLEQHMLPARQGLFHKHPCLQWQATFCRCSNRVAP